MSDTDSVAFDFTAIGVDFDALGERGAKRIAVSGMNLIGAGCSTNARVLYTKQQNRTVAIAHAGDQRIDVAYSSLTHRIRKCAGSIRIAER